ncbi:MAG TPA: hypothetical protein VF294_16160 [Polyangiaceae bacterium]
MAVVGCVEQPGAERIVGPDGTQMLHVHCGDEQVACFQMAGERCPHGYDLSPVFDPHDGNFLVRCRTPMSAPGFAAAAPSAPQPVRATANGRARPDEGWPPAEVATPTEPWPAPSSSALPPAPRTATGAVDIGY